MTSLTEPRIYTIGDFNNIINKGYTYTINQDSIDIINSLAQKVGAPSYQKTPNFSRNEKSGRNIRGNSMQKRKLKKNQEICDEDWEAIRNFQATEIKEAEGINKLINNLRTEINKISLQTYDVQFTSICSIVNELLDSNCFKEEDKIKVGIIIFDVASSNKFYSDLYSQFVKQLIDLYPWLLDIFKTSISENFKKYLDFEVADGNKDYEKFCKINKDNETRKSISTFYINLFKKDIISFEEIKNFTFEYKNLFNEKLKTEESSIVEQLAENITILINGILGSERDDDMDELFEFVNHISKSKTSQYPGLTNKTIFIFMDLHDLF